MRAERYVLGVSHLNQTFICALLFLSSLPTTSGLYVAGGSDCTSACLSNSTGSAYTTNGADVTCRDTDYSTTDVGIDFQNCVACELQTPLVERATAQTDIGWALFNIRYSLGSCLFNYPGGNTNNRTKAVSQCNSSCSNLANSVTSNLANPKITTTYDYCQDSTFLSNVDACASCYDVVQDQRYISNFLNVLQYACQYQPNTTQAFPIPPSAIFTVSPPSNYSGYSSSNNAPASGLNAATKTAIAISVPVCFFLIFSIILVCCYTHKHTKDLPPPSRTHSKRSIEHFSKSTDTEKGWSHVSKSPAKHAFSEKRSTVRGSHKHSRGPSNHSRVVNTQLNPVRAGNIPVQQPLRARSSQSQLGALYQQAKTSPQAPNPTTDTLATTYTTPSESLHSIPILVPSRYEPPVPTLGPSPRWDDEPVAPTLLPPLRSSPSSRSGPPSRSGPVSRSGPPSRSGLPSRSGPPSHPEPPSQSGSSSQPDSPSKRQPSLPPPSRWESPQTRNLPPLSRYTFQQPQPTPLPRGTHYEEPPRVSSVPPPETFQPAPSQSLPLQIQNTEPMEAAGPSEEQLRTLQSLPPPPPPASPPVTSVYNPTGLVNWEHAALSDTRPQDPLSQRTGGGASEGVIQSPLSPFTSLPSLSGDGGGGPTAGAGSGGLRRSRIISSRRSHLSSPPQTEPSTSSSRPSVSTGRPLSRIPSAEEPPSRPSTAGKQQSALEKRPGSPHPGPRRGRGLGRSRSRFPFTSSSAFSTKTTTTTHAPPPPSSLTAASFGGALPQSLPQPVVLGGQFGAPMPVASSSSMGAAVGFPADLQEKETEKERARESLRRSISSEKARREREKREREKERRGGDNKEVRWSRSVGSESGGSSKKRSPAL